MLGMLRKKGIDVGMQADVLVYVSCVTRVWDYQSAGPD